MISVLPTLDCLMPVKIFRNVLSTHFSLSQIVIFPILDDIFFYFRIQIVGNTDECHDDTNEIRGLSEHRTREYRITLIA